ncbi:hypothetical protein TNCV_3283771 [Trichonephila clavipes]|nr:hypothetical protein TNCV_3283771 [Trichonephila clavipes]
MELEVLSTRAVETSSTVSVLFPAAHPNSQSLQISLSSSSNQSSIWDLLADPLNDDIHAEQLVVAAVVIK